jgi:phage terminase large subunit
MKIDIPDIFNFLLTKNSRFKVVYGGRGGGKSESIARILLLLSLKPQSLFKKDSIRVLCAREYQSSIADSVHKIFTDIINLYELNNYFIITKSSIKTVNGSEFIFKGISNDPLQIKSTSGVDICFVEEAEKVSSESWNFLTPTIRNEGSEIWVSFNPNDKNDPTYKMFVANPLPDTIAVKVNYYDNPYFDKSPIKNEMLYDREHNPELYKNKWLGEVKQLSDALIFKDKYKIKEFETPNVDRFYFGADFGFNPDPFAVVRCFIFDNELFVDYEAGGVNIPITELHRHINMIPLANKYPIYADCARPETINHIKITDGYNIKPCEKWKGSVEDGIEYLKGFKIINIHPRCRNLIDEMGLYSNKTDRLTNEILPIIVDKYNHYIDALRYALSPYIKKRTSFQIINY